MTRLAASALAISIALLLAGCGSEEAPDEAPAPTETGSDTADTTITTAPAEEQTDEAAVAAFERAVRYLVDGQFGRAYADIHPAQQELFDLETYQRCTREGLGAVQVTDINIREVYQEDLVVPGTDITETATAITAELTYELGGVSQTDTDTFHEIYIDGRWVFTVSAADALAQGRCQ